MTNAIADKIITAVSDATGVPASRMCSPRRNRATTCARFIAMRIMRDNTFLSLDDIGDAMGWRDHSTIHKGLAKFDSQFEADPVFRATYQKAVADLNGTIIVPPRAAPPKAPKVRHITVDDVLAAVSEATGEPVERILGSGRTTRAALAKGLCVALLRERLGMSYPDIAERLNTPNHSTSIGQHKLYRDKMAVENEWMVGVDKVARAELAALPQK